MGTGPQSINQTEGDIDARIFRIFEIQKQRAFIIGELQRLARQALVLEGASALSGGANTTADDMETAGHIFSAIGKSLMMPENYLDAVTGLSGSGPAYVFMFIDALIDGGVKVGLSRQDAEILVLQTVLGSVRLALETGKHPALLKAMVTSPGGTTIAGLHELEKAGFKAGIMTAVEAATRRSEELGKLV